MEYRTQDGEKTILPHGNFLYAIQYDDVNKFTVKYRCRYVDRGPEAEAECPALLMAALLVVLQGKRKVTAIEDNGAVCCDLGTFALNPFRPI